MKGREFVGVQGHVLSGERNLMNKRGVGIATDFFFFFFCRAAHLLGSQFLDQGLKPGHDSESLES